MTKYCKDCKHCKEITQFWCLHPNTGVSEVHGKIQGTRCSWARWDDGKMCGPSALWFDPKPTLKNRLCKLLKLK